MARRRARAVEAPQTEAEAVAMIADYASAERELLRGQLMTQQQIDALKGNLGALAATIEAAQKIRFAALKAWWEAGGKDAAGRGRSAELAGVKIGVRLSPPKVKFAKGMNAANTITWLRNLRCRWLRAADLIRTKLELDKPAIIKVAQSDPAVAKLLAPAMTIEQTDEFFIDAGLDEEVLRSELATS